MTEDILVSVVIPCFRRPDLVRAAVLSVFAQDLEKHRFELIVVDSTPGPEVLDVLRELETAATCRFRYFHKEPQGPGPSRNLGARNASGEFIALLDSDCAAAPEWLREGIAAFTHDNTGIVQGRTLPEPGVRLAIFTNYVWIEKETFIYEGCNLFFRRHLYLEHCEDEADLRSTSELIQGGEDLILAWKIKRSGWQSAFAAGATVFHKVLPLEPWRWVYIQRNFIWPYLTKRVPEIRQYFFGRYFFDSHQAWFCLALAGATLWFVTPWAAMLLAPYWIGRSIEGSRSLRGPLCLLRPLFYFPRDACNFYLLARASVRYRSVLL